MSTSPKACFFGIPATIPEEWKLPNATQAACSIPYCGNTTAVLSACCGQGPSSFENYTKGGHEYLTCALSSDRIGSDWTSSAFQEEYQDFKNCIVRNEGNRFLCNKPGESMSDYCQSNSIPPPDDPVNGGDMACGMRTSRNATNTLRTCCGNDTLQVYKDGCFTMCEGDSGLHHCLQSHFPGDGGTPAIVCTRNGNSNGAACRSEASKLFAWMVLTSLALAMVT